MRSKFLVIVAAGLVVGGIALAPPVGARSKQMIKQVIVSPTRLRGGGTNVSVTIQLNERVDSSAVATSQASVSGAGSGPVATLTRRSAKLFVGSVRVPVNYDKRSAKGSVDVGIRTSTANQTRRVSITVLPADDSLPPPPPPTD